MLERTQIMLLIRFIFPEACEDMKRNGLPYNAEEEKIREQKRREEIKSEEWRTTGERGEERVERREERGKRKKILH